MHRPKISIVTPSYNQAEFLEENLQSVFSQSYDNVEHIVVDGGSNDGSVDVLRRYEDRYDLKWVSESDRGQTHALNKGIRMATGDLIGWQNSDDYYLPMAFDRVVSAVNTSESPDAVYGDVLIVDENGDEISRQFMTTPSKFVQRYWSLFASNQSLVVRSEVIKSLQLDEDLIYTMDADLTWQLLSGDYALTRVPTALGAFRVQEDAKTFANVRAEQLRELAEIYDSPWYESVVPRPLLEQAAKLLKLALLLGDGRTDAVRYNLAKKV